MQMITVWAFCIIAGQAVSVEEQVDLKDDIPAESPATSTTSLAGGLITSMNEGDRTQLEEERLKLYQQLDDKVIKRFYSSHLI